MLLYSTKILHPKHIFDIKVNPQYVSKQSKEDRKLWKKANLKNAENWQ